MWQPGKGLQEVLEKGKKMKWSGRNRHPICINTHSPIDKSKVWEVHSFDSLHALCHPGYCKLDSTESYFLLDYQRYPKIEGLPL